MSKRLCSLTRMRFRQGFLSVRVIIGNLQGFFIAFFYGWSYAKYSNTIPCGIGDAFLLLLNPYLQLSFVLLGYLIIISNLPMVNSLTLLTLIRSGRRKWIYSIIIYLIGQTCIYYTVVFLGAALPAMGVGKWQNVWSDTMIYLARFRPRDALINYGISGFDSRILDLWMPIQAIIHSWMLICCYSFFLALVILAGNLNSSMPRGTYIAIAIHFIGILMIKMGGRIRYMCSPMANAVLGMHIGEGGKSTLWFSYVFFGSLIVAMLLLIARLSKTADFIQSNSERIW